MCIIKSYFVLSGLSQSEMNGQEYGGGLVLAGAAETSQVKTLMVCLLIPWVESWKKDALSQFSDRRDN